MATIVRFAGRHIGRGGAFRERRHLRRRSRSLCCQRVWSSGRTCFEGPFGEVIRLSGTAAKENPFRFSTKRANDTSDLVLYEYRAYSAITGRWLSRDPIGEAIGGSHLYNIGGGDQINRVDVDGRFYLWMHQVITEDALQFFLRQRPVSRVCANTITIVLGSAVVEQDVKMLDDLRRHYNRGLFYTHTSRVAADHAYGAYLRQERTRFELHLRRGECRESLFALGLMSHTWQDFFAHAIRRDGMGGSEDSAFPGWTAFAIGVTGSPDARENFWPSSYSIDAEGEHPSWHEPVSPGSAEGEARKRAALVYTHKKYLTLLYQWIWDCQCECDSGAVLTHE